MSEYCKAEVGEDCISRANLIKSFLADCECESREEAGAVTLKLEDMLELIEEEPSVIPKEKEGKWIDKGWKGDWQFETDGRGNCWREYECSECGFHSRGIKFDYCPNCIAKMKG